MSDSAYIDPRTEEIGVAMPGRASSKSAKTKGGATASQAETATSGGQGVAMPGRASSEKAKTKGVAMPGATSE
jgi:hypothetical protein